ncbi:TonB-dependent receptor [Pseudoflavitalea rhizosphaerae]|uniref:TonB-dependent receptor n=1 Tax=Pseudoflavitalea rhizosphaerae TaxID=1884793 RepID=UPI0013DEDE49|nr:TonB-dependent receptor [Pseudoflavitalea rhizosphaerae]
MKLTAVLLLLFSLQAWAEGFGQTVTVNVEKVPLARVFNIIEKQSDYVFFFDQSLIEKGEKVTVRSRNRPLKEVLEECFRNQPFTWSIVGSIIVVKSKETPEQKTDSLLEIAAPYIPIKGRVVNESGQPLPGASIMIRNTNRGTNAGSDGTFSLDAEPGVTLVISFVGYESKEIVVDRNNSIINVVLTAAQNEEKDIVVIAYGRVKKSDLTGSVSQIRGSDISSFPTTNAIQALSGRAAGVRVIQNNGAPGSPISVRIRGANSILGGNEPLYIIDGLPSSPTYLQNEDIESVEILKDASSTAMYGSRGGNGVVLISTNSGKKNQPAKVKLHLGYSTQSITKKMKLLSPFQYASLYNEQAVNDGLAPYFSQQQVDSFRNIKGTDWQDLLLRKAPMYTSNVSVSGGSEKTSFFLSGGAFLQEGIIPNSDYNRYSLRTNIKHDLSRAATVSFTAAYTRTDRSTQNSQLGNRGGDMFGGMLYAPPTVEPYTPDGKYVRLNTVYPFISNAIINPLAIKNEVTNRFQVDDIVANVNLQVVPVKNLSLRVSGNIFNSNQRNDNFRNRDPYGLNSAGNANVNTSQFTSLLNENILNYKNVFGGVHSLDVVGGVMAQMDKSTSMGSGNATDFLSNEVFTGSIQSAAVPGLPTTTYAKTVLLSYVSRINYGFDNRYLLTFSFRRDGFSPYSAENRWANFPSAAIAWRASNEKFMEGLPAVSDLKLRASYGRTGNTSISPYQSLNILQPYNTIFGDALTIGYAPRPEYSSKLKWELTDQVDIGLDLGLFNNKIRLTADYYQKHTKYLLNKVQLPTSFGYETSLQNVGEISNKGVELGIDATVISNANWKWELSGNISFNRNKVEKLYKGQDINGTNIFTGNINDYVNLLREGLPVYVFYGYIAEGYTETGNIKYQDKNGDKSINNLDRSVIGDPNPDFIYGMSSVTKYKGFELTVFIQGSQGNDLFNLNKASTLDMGWGLNQPEEVFTDHWTADKTNAKYPKPSSKISANFSTRFVEDGSYLKFRNIQLAYNIPVAKLKTKAVKSAQLYVSAQNMIIITNYSGYDPEVNVYGGANSMVQGVDYTAYPNSKSFTVGIRCGF